MMADAQTQTITVVVSEKSSPLPPVSPWPLIYTVDVKDPKDHAEVLAAVAAERMDELGIDESNLDEVLDGIEIHFAFAGDVNTLTDFRG